MYIVHSVLHVYHKLIYGGNTCILVPGCCWFFGCQYELAYL